MDIGSSVVAGSPLVVPNRDLDAVCLSIHDERSAPSRPSVGRLAVDAIASVGLAPAVERIANLIGSEDYGRTAAIMTLTIQPVRKIVDLNLGGHDCVNDY
jgi:hypothetical protein